MFRTHEPLRPRNTFRVDANAEYFAEFHSEGELQELLHERSPGKDTMILGGGSNILITADIPGYVLSNNVLGIELLSEDDEGFTVRVGGGEVWHHLVEYAIGQGWAGIENLALIPGKVGASPIQNIGAYGVEMRETFHSLEAVHLETGEIHTFTNGDCEFGYRDSIFKRHAKGQFAITHVTYRFKRTPNLRTDYGAIKGELELMGISSPSIRDVADAVIRIRRSKLPDPELIGNSGSFFKNPVIAQEEAKVILQNHPNAPNYPGGEGRVKLAAGWLIEQAGWKGYDAGGYGVHDKQALVLVNRGAATGKQIYDLSTEIIESVKEKFGVELEREVNIIP